MASYTCGGSTLVNPVLPKPSGNVLLSLLFCGPDVFRRDAKALFTDWKGGFYQHNKLANVYTAFELQRRCDKHPALPAAAHSAVSSSSSSL
jgi:hypothetical protein